MNDQQNCFDRVVAGCCGCRVWRWPAAESRRLNLGRRNAASGGRGQSSVTGEVTTTSTFQDASKPSIRSKSGHASRAISKVHFREGADVKQEICCSRSTVDRLRPSGPCRGNVLQSKGG